MSGMQPHDPKCPGWTDTLQRAAELIARAYTNREMAEIEFVTMHGAKKQVGRVRQHLEADATCGASVIGGQTNLYTWAYSSPPSCV